MSDAFEIDEEPMALIPLEVPVALPAAAASKASGLLGSFAVELWRIKTRLGRALPLLPPKEARPLETSVLRLEELLTEAGITIEDPTGRPYVEGERLEVLLFEPSPQVTRPTIVQTVKPSVYQHNVLLKPAEVIVAIPGTPDAPPA
jgi:hypothetical protein